MDAQVLAAMARWPDVPDVYGWLQLDRRGRYRLRTVSAAGGVIFEPIGNPAFNAYIGRNYQSDERGRWYFQNGPQRVFVRLALAPWVFRFDSGGVALAHTGTAVRGIDRLLLDEHCTPFLATHMGLGAVDDRDLDYLLERIAGADGQPLDGDQFDAWLSAPAKDPYCFIAGRLRLPVEPVMRATLPGRFGFDPDPAAR